MDETPKLTANAVAVVAYDPSWPTIYAAERDLLLGVAGSRFVAFEHVGSTAVVGLRAKPIIDMMAAVVSLDDCKALLAPLAALGYHPFDTGMRDRLFLRKQATQPVQAFHLHIVEHATWDTRNERLLRDYLQAHEEAVQAYGELKDRLAAEHTHDSLAYTKAKTAFIQEIIDQARDQRRLPRVDVGEE